MSKRPISRGTCVFCENTYARSGMSRHLQSCKVRKEAISAEGALRTRLFHLFVGGTYATDYWMHLEVPAKATLQDLDRFLRAIWLECCGHLSMFEIGDTRYQCMTFDDDMWGMGDPNMDIRLGKVLTPGLQFSHEYDFGTTTYLVLKVVSEREGVMPKGEQVRILARNEPPDYRCAVCQKPATWINVFQDYLLLCEECVIEEGYDEGLLPVVNSPRAGECGYTGDASW